VSMYSGPKFRHLAHPSTSLAARPRAEPATEDAATKLGPGPALLLALLSSLGLWAAIWKAASSLAVAWLG
jgi:hypothetical protein